MSIRPIGSGHLSDGTLMAYLDEELEAGSRASVGHHVVLCRPCGQRLSELRSVSGRLSQGLEVMGGDADFVTGATERSSSGAAGEAGWAHESPASGHEATGRLVTRRVGAWATALLVLSAGALAAIPGSPVHAWLLRRVTHVARPAAAGAGAVPPAPVVSILPDEGSVTVRLRGTTPATRIQVRLVTSGDAHVTAAGASFRAGPGFVDIAQDGSGRPVTIDLPRSVRSARVEIDGRTVVVKKGARLRALGAATRTSDDSLEVRGGGR